MWGPGQRVYRKSLYLPLNFSGNLKLAFIKKLIFKSHEIAEQHKQSAGKKGEAMGT